MRILWAGVALVWACVNPDNVFASGVEEPNAKSGSFADFDRRARAGEQLNVVFFGGSLTWGANSSDPQRTSYRALMAEWLRGYYPKASFAFHDAAIGGTGSKLGLFRVERDVMARNPNMVFLDFTVNDDATFTTMKSLASYEGVLRRIVERGVPVVQMLFCFRDHVGSGCDTLALPRYVAHLRLATSYGAAVGDAMKRMKELLDSGRIDRDTVWPWKHDGCHPDDPGYAVFFEAARDGFLAAVDEKRTCKFPDAPVFSDRYRNARRHLIVDRELPRGWVRAKAARTAAWFDGQPSRWMDDMAACRLDSDEVAEPLIVEFEGTMIGIFGEKNGKSLPFHVKIDGRPLPYRSSGNESSSWPNDTAKIGGANLFYWIELTDELGPGKHFLELRPMAGASAGDFKIESVCSAGE